MTTTLHHASYCDAENEILAWKLADIRAHRCGNLLAELEITVDCPGRECERLGHCPKLVTTDEAEPTDDCDLKTMEFNGSCKHLRSYR